MLFRSLEDNCRRVFESHTIINIKFQGRQSRMIFNVFQIVDTNVVGNVQILFLTHPLGRGSEKFIQIFIHRGSLDPNPSRRINVTFEFTGKCVIQIYSKQAGRGSEVNIISGRSRSCVPLPVHCARNTVLFQIIHRPKEMHRLNVLLEINRKYCICNVRMETKCCSKFSLVNVK